MAETVAAKLPIWGRDIPGNNPRSKLADMDVHPEWSDETVFRDHPGVFDSTAAYVDDLSGNETLVYRAEIEPGKAKSTYEDEPYLVPYLSPGSDRSVIVCPGGAYLLKSMDNEGEDVAAFLNDAGFNCFVLWYRSYPYRAPAMFLDCQRSIRYLRSRSADFGLDPEKIGLLGFSAGGNLAATTVHLFGDRPVEFPGYVPDAVDGLSARIRALGLVYPAVSFERAQVFLECIVPKAEVADPARRAELSELYTLKNRVAESDPPAFLCAAADDTLIPADLLAEYGAALAGRGVAVELHLLAEGGHGFGGCHPSRHPEADPAVLASAGRWRGLFTAWLGRTLGGPADRAAPTIPAAPTAPSGRRLGVNPYLPSWEYVPDAEPRVFGDRVYAYGSHDRFNGCVYCLGDYVLWSAPVDDLAAWRREGTIYRAEDVEDNLDRNSCLYAPDAVRGPDGRYYLYYVDSKRSIVSVAVADAPAARFRFLGYVRDRAGGVLGARPGDEPQFDPAVLVEDGRAYLYTGFCAVGDRSRSGAMATVLAGDMLTILEEPTVIAPSQPYAAGSGFEGHEFFEAPSIRKRNGLYYFVYSSVAMHELCYAVSRSPTGGFAYGGVVISNADLGIGSYKPAAKPMYYGANNHGGLAEIGGKWYVFYHRHTNGTQFSRQGCLEELAFRDDGSIVQAEITSSGPNGGPLPGVGEYPAYIACHLFRREESLYTDCTSAWMDGRFPKITQDGGEGKGPAGHIANMKDSATAGFRYFDCRGVKRIAVKARGYARGEFLVKTAWDGPVLARLPIGYANGWRSYEAPVSIPDGVHSLYFEYSGEGAAQLGSFSLFVD
jgi:acetyl esterase/lipase